MGDSPEDDSAVGTNAPGGAEDDYALMDAAARGDATSFAALYDRHAGAVYALCLRVLFDSPAAEDVLLEVFQGVWEGSNRYDRGRGSPLAFLLLLARRQAIERVPRWSASREGALSANHDGSVRDSAGVPVTPGPPERATGRGVRCLVTEALARLEPDQRRAVEYCLYEGLNQTEIADRLNESPGTVKSCLCRALGRLREVLNPYDGELL